MLLRLSLFEGIVVFFFNLKEGCVCTLVTSSYTDTAPSTHTRTHTQLLPLLSGCEPSPHNPALPALLLRCQPISASWPGHMTYGRAGRAEWKPYTTRGERERGSTHSDIKSRDSVFLAFIHFTLMILQSVCLPSATHTRIPTHTRTHANLKGNQRS